MHYITVGDVFFKKRKERSRQTGLRENREAFFFLSPFEAKNKPDNKTQQRGTGSKEKKKSCLQMLSESEQTRSMSQTQPGPLFPFLWPQQWDQSRMSRPPTGINRSAALRRREGDSHWGHTSQEVRGVPESQESRVKGSQEGLDRELDIINSYAGAALYHC